MNTVFSPYGEYILVKDLSDIIDFNDINEVFNIQSFNLNMYNNVTDNFTIFDEGKFNNTKLNLEEECEGYLNNAYGIKDYYEKLIITNSWGNITEPGQSHHQHIHSFSVVSGVLYLDDNPENLNLNFLIKNKTAPIPYFMEPPLTFNMSLKNILDINNINPIEHNNLKNHLILFLSNLIHYVSPIELESPRKSISFNTFWKGKVGHQTLRHEALSSIDYNEVLFPHQSSSQPSRWSK
jgi:uncharacterized protein (TIGR02466 family)